MIDFFSSASSSVLAVAIDTAAKAPVLMVLALVVHATLGRRRALARSALWNACLAGLMVLPVASWALPRVRVAVVPPRAAVSIEASTPPRNGPLPAEVTTIETPPVVASPAIAPATVLTTTFATVRPSPPSVLPSTIAQAPPVVRLTAPELVLSVYLAGAALLLLKLAGSLVAVGRLRRRCEPIQEPAWLTAQKRWITWMGISRRVSLGSSDRVSIPIVVGWLRPAIILPRSLAVAPNAGLVDAVLLHELSHVRRGDFGWNLVRKLVQIVYWPHPLIWPLGRILHDVREQACDDICVFAMGGAPAYRASLIAVASGLVRRPEPALGLAMAQTTKLGRRLSWIDESHGSSRCVLRRPARLTVTASLVAIAGLLGSIELARATMKAVEESESQTKTPENSKTVAATVANALPPAIEVTVLARDTAKPLAGATVKSWVDFTTFDRKTDHSGRVQIDFSRVKFRDSLVLDVWAEGYVQQRHSFAQNDARSPKIPARFTIELLPGEQTLGGTVVDEKGQPIAGVQVEIQGHLGEKKDNHEMAYMVDAHTDEQGRWHCRCFRDMQFAYLYLSHPDYLADGQYHPRLHGPPSPSDRPGLDKRPLQTLLDFTDRQVMTRGVVVAGKVSDHEGKPVSGAEVGWLDAGQQFALHDELATTATDAEGQFRFSHARPGRLILQVKARGHAPELKPVVGQEAIEPVLVKLGPPRILSGRVVDTKGRPIPDVFVNVDAWRGYRALGVLLKSGPDGRFRWEDAPADPVLINASRAGYDGVSMRSASPDDGELLLMFKRALAISGSIRDGVTGQRVENVQVEEGIVEQQTGKVSWSTSLRVFGSQGHLQASLDAENADAFRLRIKAKGYEPFETRIFRGDEGQVEYDVKLTKSDKPQGDPISGVVRRTDGTPLEGAEIAVTYPMSGERFPLLTVQIDNGKIRPRDGQTIVKSDAQGRFTTAREPDPAGRYWAVVVVHPEFYAEADHLAFEKRSTIAAKPWGRVEGFARTGDKPAAGTTIRHFGDRPGNRDMPYVYDSGRTKADDRGHFVLERVVPGDVRVAFAFGEEPTKVRAWSNGTLIEVKPGATAQVKLGGRGRPVVAKVVPPAGFDPKADYTIHSEFEIQSDRPVTPYPKEMLARRDGPTMIAWGKQWAYSAEGRAYRSNWFGLYQAKLQPDGTIRAEDVPPGEYRLNLTYSADPIRGLGLSPDRIAHATRQFTIPEIPAGQSGQPFDLGVLRPRIKQTLKVGQAVPAFEVETLDGRRLKLEDFRGKYLLLDFWATWCGPCIAELPELKAVYDRFSVDERFAMLSLSLDADKEAPRKLVAAKGLRWTQGFLGEWAEAGVTDAYHVEAIPAIFLIGPDGKLRAQGLQGDAIAAAVANALAQP